MQRDETSSLPRKSSLYLCSLFVGAQTAQVENRQWRTGIQNIQSFGLTVEQFMGTMGFIAAALSMNCSNVTTQAAQQDLPRITREQMARRIS